MASEAHGAGKGKDVDALGAGASEQAGADVAGGAGGHHVVHEEERLAAEVPGMGGAVGLRRVAEALLAAEARLGGDAGADAAEQARLAGDVERVGGGAGLAVATMRGDGYVLYTFKDFVPIADGKYINASAMPYDLCTANILDFIDTRVADKFYISAAGCAGILRRKEEHNSRINPRLEAVLRSCSAVCAGKVV